MCFFATLSVICTLTVLYFIFRGMVVQQRNRRQKLTHNQPLILIANLLIADLLEAVSACLDFYWLHLGQMLAPSAICSAQALLLQIGIMCNGFFILAIAIITWMRILRRASLSRGQFFTLIAAIWIIGIIVAFAGFMKHPGGFYTSIGVTVRPDPILFAGAPANVIDSVGSPQCIKSISCGYIVSGFSDHKL